VTLNDVSYSFYSEAGFNGALQYFCGARELNGQQGVLISVVGPVPFDAELALTLTLWHNNARDYGAAVFYCSAEDPNC
jgi:hypothetical protein